MDKIIVNRYILREYFDEHTADKIIKKAISFKDVKCFYKMATTHRKWMVSSVHFDMNEFIQAQEEHCNTVRIDYRRSNELFLEQMKNAFYEQKIRA